MKFFAQILAIYFLIGSILPGSDFSQLEKAPAVWEHYKLHQQLAAESGGKFSFTDFLTTHFLYPYSHQHNDCGNSHQNLPLKTVHVFSPVLLASNILPEIHSRPAFPGQAFPHYTSFAGSIHEGAVFRPPILS